MTSCCVKVFCRTCKVCLLEGVSQSETVCRCCVQILQQICCSVIGHPHASGTQPLWSGTIYQ